MSKQVKQSKLSSSKFLFNRLERLSHFVWVAYVVDDQLFKSMPDAILFARRLAKLTRAPVEVYSIEVPSALPKEPRWDCVHVEDTELNVPQNVTVYFVNNIPFRTEHEAKAYAQDQANATGCRHTVMITVVDGRAFDFVEHSMPTKKVGEA